MIWLAWIKLEFICQIIWLAFIFSILLWISRPPHLCVYVQGLLCVCMCLRVLHKRWRCADCMFVCVCVFYTDSGPSGESCGFRADTEACERPHLPPGAAAAKNPGTAEWHTDWWVAQRSSLPVPLYACTHANKELNILSKCTFYHNILLHGTNTNVQFCFYF